MEELGSGLSLISATRPLPSYDLWSSGWVCASLFPTQPRAPASPLSCVHIANLTQHRLQANPQPPFLHGLTQAGLRAYFLPLYNDTNGHWNQDSYGGGHFSDTLLSLRAPQSPTNPFYALLARLSPTVQCAYPHGSSAQPMARHEVLETSAGGTSRSSSLKMSESLPCQPHGGARWDRVDGIQNSPDQW